MEPERTETVARVVDIGLDLVTVRGYGGTALRDVAEAVGFSKAALYHHFPTKAALLEEMLSPLCSAIDELLEEDVGADLDEDRARLLAGMLDIAFAHRREAAVLFGDRAVGRLEPGRSWAMQRRALIRRLSGPRARVMTQIRATSALLLVLQPATNLFSVAEDVLRSPILQIAIETCTGSSAPQRVPSGRLVSEAPRG